MATRWNSSIIWRNSTVFDFKKLRLAGTLKNKLLTDIEVPSGATTKSCVLISPPAILILVASSSAERLVCISTWATAAMEASASPRNPLVCSANKSSDCLILDVACRSKAKRASVALMPNPLSTTWINCFPASAMINWILVALASIAFSSNSFTTEAGRWTTSPAAIWLATWSGSKAMISSINYERKILKSKSMI